MKPEKLGDQALKELARLANERAGDAAMSVLQLVDDPDDAAMIVVAIAASMFKLAGRFAHTNKAIQGEFATHDDVVLALLLECSRRAREHPPTTSEIKMIEGLKRFWQRGKDDKENRA